MASRHFDAATTSHFTDFGNVLILSRLISEAKLFAVRSDETVVFLNMVYSINSDQRAAIVYSLYRRKEILDIMVCFISLRVGVKDRWKFRCRIAEIFPIEAGGDTDVFEELCSKIFNSFYKTVAAYGMVEVWPSTFQRRRRRCKNANAASLLEL